MTARSSKNPSTVKPTLSRSQASGGRVRGKGDAEQAAIHSQGVVAPRAEPSRQSRRRQSGDRKNR